MFLPIIVIAVVCSLVAFGIWVQRIAPKLNAEPTYTLDEVDAALSVWECLIDWRADRMHPGEHFTLNAVWDRVGWSQMRHFARELGVFCERVYQQMDPQLKDIPFDWEIVPAILRTVTWQGESYGLPTVDVALAAAEHHSEAF